MSFPVRPNTLVLALAAAAAMALPAQGALAAGSPGGASAPTASRTAGAAPRVHRIRSSGIATWFGPGFYGQKTACGQVLTPEVIGVAHRTLPCGTLVRVSYAGRTITVPVLDRGPYSFADWDLTAGAARALGVSDTVRIRTKVVGHAANTPGLGLPPGSTSQSLAGGALAG